MKTKLLSALLTGVNRAFPYSKVTGKTFEKLTDTLFRIVHTSTYNTSVQALMLLLQVMTAQNALSDRFYRALYQRLLQDDIRRTAKHSMLLNVVYKAVKVDNHIGRSRAFVMRLLQMCCYSMNNPFVCAVLYMISEMMKVKPELKKMISDLKNRKKSTEADASVVEAATNDADQKQHPNALKNNLPKKKRWIE